MQADEIVVYWLILNGCNVILRYNIWYNKTSISMPFIALFETNEIHNYLILKHFKENNSGVHYFLDNIILAKWRVKGEIKSFSFFIATAFYRYFFYNLVDSNKLLLNLV